MKTLEKLVLVAMIIALLGAFITTLHTYIEGERWAWYDAGYDDAMADYGISLINGKVYLEDCCLGEYKHSPYTWPYTREEE